MKRGILVAAFVLLALVLATGCGGDDSEASITKAEFIEQANAVCKKVLKAKAGVVNEELAQRKKEGKSLELDQKAASKLIAVALPPISETPEELEELGAPEGEEEKVEAMIVSFDKGLAEMEEDPESAFGGTYPLKAFDDEAEEYGLTACRF